MSLIDKLLSHPAKVACIGAAFYATAAYPEAVGQLAGSTVRNLQDSYQAGLTGERQAPGLQGDQRSGNIIADAVNVVGNKAGTLVAHVKAGYNGPQ